MRHHRQAHTQPHNLIKPRATTNTMIQRTLSMTTTHNMKLKSRMTTINMLQRTRNIQRLSPFSHISMSHRVPTIRLLKPRTRRRHGRSNSRRPLSIIHMTVLRHLPSYDPRTNRINITNPMRHKRDNINTRHIITNRTKRTRPMGTTRMLTPTRRLTGRTLSHLSQHITTAPNLSHNISRTTEVRRLRIRHHQRSHIPRPKLTNPRHILMTTRRQRTVHSRILRHNLNLHKHRQPIRTVR